MNKLLITKIFIVLALFLMPLKKYGQIDSVKTLQKINNLDGGLSGSPLANTDRFGVSVDVIGDVDHDGIDDVVVGSYLDDDGVTNQGAVYILMLNADGTVKSQQKISATVGNGPDDFSSFHLYFGIAVTALGDLNGDGNVDIAVGMYGGGDVGVSGNYGAIYILFLDDDGTVLEYQKISNNEGGGNGFLGAGDLFGIELDNIGDVNGDGLPELVVGATSDDDGGTDRGAIYIISLDYNGTAKNIQKISDTQGGFSGVLDNTDWFGTGIAGIGDVDGDGIVDVAVGARRDDDGSTDRGAVWILFLNADGTVSSEQKISDTQGNFTGTLDNSDYFGSKLACVGDLDGNGVRDLAVGAELDDDGGANAGALWILYLDVDGTVIDYGKISALDTKLSSQIVANDRFAKGLAYFGDRNNDGKVDLFVGAYNASDGTTSSGEVYTLHMEDTAIYPTKTYHSTSSYITTLEKHSAASGEPLASELNASDYYGVSSCGIGDLDGDGIDDMVVGAYADDDGGSNKGAVYVQFLNADGSIKSYQKISDTQGGFNGILSGGAGFGIGVGAIGDLDNDGNVDVAVGTFKDDDGGTDRGAVWILFLNNNGTVKSEQKISDTQGGFTGVLSNSDWFGYALKGGEDIDGDGINDLVVGARMDDDGGTDRGALWLLFLDTTGNVQWHQKISDTQGDLTTALGNGDYFGQSITFIGDMDGDGVPDIATGAHGDDDGGTNRGSIYVIQLTDSGKVKTEFKISNTTGNFDGVLDNSDYFGSGIEGGYDFNGDAINDILVGSAYHDNGGLDRGGVWMLMMNADGTVNHHKTISATSKTLLGQIDDSDRLGIGVSVVAYDAATNMAKIGLGAYLDDDGATNAGAMHIVEVKTYLDLAVDYVVTPDHHEGFGTIELTPKDGTAPYYYFWADGEYSQNRYELESGIYNVTIVDTIQDSLSVAIIIGEELAWDSLTGVTTYNDLLEKTSATTSWGTGIASLNNIVEDNGEAQVTIAELGKEWSYGFRLTANSQATEYADMEYAFHIDTGNKLYSYENSTYTFLANIVIGDVISIERNDTQMVFKKNGSTLRSGDHNGTDKYVIDFSLKTGLMTLGKIKAIQFPYFPKIRIKPVIVHNLCYIPFSGSIDISVLGGLPPYTYAWSGPGFFTATTQDISGIQAGNYWVVVVSNNGVMTSRMYEVGYQVNWTDAVGATKLNNTIQKTTANGYNNSGGASNNTLEINTWGWAEFNINDDAVDELLFGLSDVNTDLTIGTIDYGFRFFHFTFWSTTIPLFVITEGGVDVPSTLGWASDLKNFKIRREDFGAGVIKIRYYQNNQFIYESPTASTSTLIVDLSMDKMNSKVINANVSFGNCPVSGYATLKKKLDAAFYVSVGDKLRFQYEEEYSVPNTTDIDAVIYKSDQSEIASVPTPDITKLGANYYELDLSGLTGFVSGKYYVLELTNKKAEKFLLRFLYQ